MNKVVTISLAGRAYELEEAGYDALRRYLDSARAALSGDPDLEEIMRDLEAAIAEKLSARMRPGENVARGGDVEAALAEMGPVGGKAPEGAAHAQSGTPKKLYRLPEAGWIWGVCAGLAAYFDIDVTLVRIAFVALAILTGGGFFLAYFLMVILIPVATTPEERSAAYGASTITAQTLIENARKGYEEGMRAWQKWETVGKAEWKAHKAEMKRQAKQQRRAWKHQGRAWQEYGYSYYPHRTPTVAEELVHVAILAAVVWAVYTYIPGTQPFLDHLWALIERGWQWIFAQIAR
ncbi:MAG TPA: PspC domain-containing protein [Candidatus Paceibacterota bacterium]|nr:PspC domain-containing protein [Candidatus Paceibacterota bacterium]